jgi:hypothetical protein
MVVIAARQPGLRPETIRTRLARFMPTRAAAGWTVSWSAHVEHAEDIVDEHELQIAEHLGCYGSAVGHALAQSELTVQQLRLSADCTSGEGDTETITIEVRAQIEGLEVDQTVFDAIVRRAEPSCPVLKGLASEVSLRLIAVLDQSGEGFVKREPGPSAPSQLSSGTPTKPTSGASKTPTATAPTPAGSDAKVAQATAKPSGSPMRRIDHATILGRLHAPKWLTGRMAVLLAVAFGVCATLPGMWANAA